MTVSTTISSTVTGVQGVNEDVLRRAHAFPVLTPTTTAQYASVKIVTTKVESATATFTVTGGIIANPELLASLERAIERLEPGKLLTDKDVFGDEDESDAE